MNSKEIVRKGYDAASHQYRSNAGIDPDDPQLEATSRYHEWLDRLESELEPGARILELGCGCGLPVARHLANKYQYTGVDLSPVQCKRARRLVLQAHIVCSDMTTVDFPPSNFDATLAFFSIIHVPLEEKQTLIHRSYPLEKIL